MRRARRSRARHEQVTLARKALLALAIITAAVALAASCGGDATLAMQAASLPAGVPASDVGTASFTCAAPANGDLTPEQQANVAIIMSVARTLRVPPRGMVVAVATARQESGLLNLSGGHLDSVGLFQQRDKWGTFTSRRDPAAAARMFFTGGAQGQPGLLDVPGWQALPVTVAAQTVQGSKYPDAYAQWQGLAERAVGASTCTAAPAVTPVKASGAGKVRSDSLACPVGGPGRVELAPGGVPIRVCDVRGMGVNATAAGNFARMLDAASAAGLDIGGSAFRSTARQIELRREPGRYQRNRRGCAVPDPYMLAASRCFSPPTAPPGKSMHEWGLAADLTCSGALIATHLSPCWTWLAAHAPAYGFHPLSSEAWHWSTSGG
jgi:hypothetical protein